MSAYRRYAKTYINPALLQGTDSVRDILRARPPWLIRRGTLLLILLLVLILGGMALIPYKKQVTLPGRGTVTVYEPLYKIII